METVQHLTNEHQFVIECGGKQAELHYRLSKNQNGTAIDFYSTFVPPEFRGKGFAEKLVRTGISWAKEQGFELNASCWYAAKFIR